MTAATRARSPGAGAGTLAAAAFVVIGAILLGVLRNVGGSPPEGAVAAIAFASPFAAAGLLAVIGARSDRPWLLTAAGAALLPLSFISLAGVTLPLLVPAFLFAREGIRGHRQWCVAGAAVASLTAPALVGSFVLLLVHDDPVSWTDPDGAGGGGTSDIITTAEALRTLAVVIVILALAMAVGRCGGDGPAPRRRRGRAARRAADAPAPAADLT